MNGHEQSECSLSNNISTRIPRDSLFFSEEEERNGVGVNAFQTRAICGNF